MPLILYIGTILFVPDDIIEELDKLFYEFIWPSGKHHVKKVVLTQGISDGGLKMPNISVMLKSIKLNWIKSLLKETSIFKSIAMTGIHNIPNFLQKKIDLSLIAKRKCPPFYRQLFVYWNEIHGIEPVTVNEILNEQLWFNSRILVDGKPVFYQNWSDKGICTLHDIVNEQGFLLPLEGIERKFGIHIKNVMQYNSLIAAVPSKWVKCLKNHNTTFSKIEVTSVKIKKIYKPVQKVKCKEFYWQCINSISEVPSVLYKWEEHYFFYDFDWKAIFQLPFNVARETKLQSFQYQIINMFVPCGVA